MAEENYLELPFLEKDFAVWMDQLEHRLLNEPPWHNLVMYKGISLYDAAYAPLYWGLLDAYRKTYNPKSLSNRENENPTDLLNRSKAVLRRLQQGEIAIFEGIKIAKTRLITHAKMELPPQKLPEFPKQKRTLVVRVSQNQSAFPVLPALKNEGATILFASWSDKLQEPVEELGIPYINLKDFYRRKYQSTYFAHQKAVTKLLSSVDPYLPGQLFGKLSQYSLNWNALKLLKKNFTQARVYVDLYLDLLVKYKPEVVVLFNENSPPGRTMAIVAKSVNISSVAIQHGLFIGYVYRNLATDKILVWGELPRKFWLARGCKPEQVVSVGAIAHKNWQQKSQINLHSSKGKKQPTVLVVGQNPAAFLSLPMHRRTIKAIMQAVEQLPEVRFIIKPHPGENPKPYQDAMQETSSENVKLVTHGPIEPFLHNSALVITVFSTVSLEAMLLGRPVLVLNLSSEPPLAPYTSAALLVTQSDMLSKEIAHILDDKHARKRLVEAGYKFAQDYLGSMDGNAARRGADAISDFTYLTG